MEVSVIFLHMLGYGPRSNPLYFYKEYLWHIFTLDCAVIAYTYKHYFGRSIFYEMDPHDHKKFVYKPETHTYARKSDDSNGHGSGDGGGDGDSNGGGGGDDNGDDNGGDGSELTAPQ